ncbi:MAG: hypothetical protein IJ761_02275 [Bacteroidales bacterium]|nr:hypothetical protein [Bacteroidales bacterium]
MNRRFLLTAALICAVAFTAVAQSSPTSKRERKKNLVVKEWNLRTGSKTPYLDNLTTYDDLGRKVEEIEYASYGQKKRTVYEYEGNSTKCSRQVEYDDKNRPSRIKVFEYNDDGTRKKQYNYKPNGKLETTKSFEYSYK